MNSQMNAMKLSLWMFAAVGASVASAACGSADFGDDAAGETATSNEGEVGVAEAAVLNGAALPGDDFSGLVRLWLFNTKFNELRQFCTGVLLRNSVVLTAKHCLEFTPAALAHGWPDIRANVSGVIATTDLIGFGAFATGAPAYAPDGRDLAAIKLTDNLPVRVNGQVVTTNFFQPLSGTPPSGAPLIVVGYGPPGDATSTICSYTSLTTGQRLKGCVADKLQPNWWIGTAFNNAHEILTIGVTSTSGDSGGSTRLLQGGATGLADLPLAGINSLARKCVPLNSSNCGAVSVRLDDIGTWLTLLQ